jgi:hypothetical protein
MTASDLYDFETNVPDAIVPAFTAAGLQAITLSIAPDFQKPRPRSELFFRPGPAVNPPRIMLVDGKRVIAAYEGDLEITSITDTIAANKLTHSAYRAAIRQLMELDAVRTACNLATSPYKLDFVMPAGSTETVKTDEGYELSRLTYRVQFSIKQDAFEQLAAA